MITPTNCKKTNKSAIITYIFKIISFLIEIIS
ncbi:hypothetical protein SAMN04515674_103213 [Pseudarcicella hirudinis]|uniref:Uncharacterized protein n=1 Tax=Pseudarcicella hirudinis TaxID=1079859 RepID=A0A1I5QIP2_9BACT|nr:hypothetical protein SAMN04515674_103213 [Pseudarcicella hirudinis]